MPGGSASTGDPAGGGTEYFPDSKPTPNLALKYYYFAPSNRYKQLKSYI